MEECRAPDCPTEAGIHLAFLVGAGAMEQVGKLEE